MNLGHIMYSQLDGRYHAFLLTGLVKPKALAVDPVDGFVLHNIDHRWSRHQIVRICEKIGMKRKFPTNSTVLLSVRTTWQGLHLFFHDG